MKVTIVSAQRRKPQIGDRQVTKKHGLRVRVVETHSGMWVTSGGRYRYEWRRPHELVGTPWEYLLTSQDRELISQRAAVLAHAADIESAVLFGHA